MNGSDRYTRVNKFEKRRKNTKAISFLIVIGGILAIILLVFLIFPEKGEKVTKQDNHNNEWQSDELNSREEDNNKEKSNNDQSNHHEHINNSDDHNNLTGEDGIGDNDHIIENEQDESNSDSDNHMNEIIVEPLEPNDDNVIEAYTGNWEPIGTEQEEPHTTQFDKETQDWYEMEQAIRLATGLDEMITLWIGNGGEQKVIGTVSSMDGSDIYRVYLSWITNKGWKPVTVERLRENDAGPSEN